MSWRKPPKIAVRGLKRGGKECPSNAEVAAEAAGEAAVAAGQAAAAAGEAASAAAGASRLSRLSTPKGDVTVKPRRNPKEVREKALAKKMAAINQKNKEQSRAGTPRIRTTVTKKKSCPAGEEETTIVERVQSGPAVYIPRYNKKKVLHPEDAYKERKLPPPCKPGAPCPKVEKGKYYSREEVRLWEQWQKWNEFKEEVKCWQKNVPYVSAREKQERAFQKQFAKDEEMQERMYKAGRLKVKPFHMRAGPAKKKAVVRSPPTRPCPNSAGGKKRIEKKDAKGYYIRYNCVGDRHPQDIYESAGCQPPPYVQPPLREDGTFKMPNERTKEETDAYMAYRKWEQFYFQLQAWENDKKWEGDPRDLDLAKDYQKLPKKGQGRARAPDTSTPEGRAEARAAERAAKRAQMSRTRIAPGRKPDFSRVQSRIGGLIRGARAAARPPPAEPGRRGASPAEPARRGASPAEPARGEAPPAEPAPCDPPGGVVIPPPPEMPFEVYETRLQERARRKRAEAVSNDIMDQMYRHIRLSEMGLFDQDEDEEPVTQCCRGPSPGCILLNETEPEERLPCQVMTPENFYLADQELEWPDYREFQDRCANAFVNTPLRQRAAAMAAQTDTNLLHPAVFRSDLHRRAEEVDVRSQMMSQLGRECEGMTQDLPEIHSRQVQRAWNISSPDVTPEPQCAELLAIDDPSIEEVFQSPRVRTPPLAYTPPRAPSPTSPFRMPKRFAGGANPFLARARAAIAEPCPRFPFRGEEIASQAARTAAAAQPRVRPDLFGAFDAEDFEADMRQQACLDRALEGMDVTPPRQQTPTWQFPEYRQTVGPQYGALYHQQIRQPQLGPWHYQRPC